MPSFNDSLVDGVSGEILSIGEGGGGSGVPSLFIMYVYLLRRFYKGYETFARCFPRFKILPHAHGKRHLFFNTKQFACLFLKTQIFVNNPVLTAESCLSFLQSLFLPFIAHWTVREHRRSYDGLPIFRHK